MTPDPLPPLPRPTSRAALAINTSFSTQQQSQQQQQHQQQPSSSEIQTPNTSDTVAEPDWAIPFDQKWFSSPVDPNGFVSNQSEEQGSSTVVDLSSTLPLSSKSYNNASGSSIAMATKHIIPVTHARSNSTTFYTRLLRLNTPQANPQRIVSSFWASTRVLFGIRLLMFLYCTVVLISDMVMTERIRYEFCFLTQLSYAGLTAYLATVTFHTGNALFSRHQSTPDCNNTSVIADQTTTSTVIENNSSNTTVTTTTTSANSVIWYTRTANNLNLTSRSLSTQHWFLTDLIFFLYQTVCAFGIVVPLLFWAYETYSGDAKMMAVDLNPASLWRNYSFHGGDLIVILIEVCLNAMPIFLIHFVPVILVVCGFYLLETQIVWHVDGFWIYPFLDTTNPWWPLLYGGVGFVIFMAFLAMAGVHKVKEWLFMRRVKDDILTSLPTTNIVTEMTTTSAEMMDVERGIDLSYHNSAFADGYSVSAVVEGGCGGAGGVDNSNRKRSDSSTSQATLIGDEDKDATQQSSKTA